MQKRPQCWTRLDSQFTNYTRGHSCRHIKRTEKIHMHNVIMFLSFSYVASWDFIHSQELKRERAKAAAALKSLQEKLEEKFQKELEQKVHILFFFFFFGGGGDF